MEIDTNARASGFRRTKIVATLGPQSDSFATMTALVRAGANLFRLNMSHGTHEEHRQRVLLARRVAEAEHRPIALLADLCGPKIRVGSFENGSIDLIQGERVSITTADVMGRPGLIPTSYAALAADVVPRDRILLDDGNLELRVEEVRDGIVVCEVVAGGKLKDKKGMNLPGVAVSVPSLTDKDRADARFALELGVEFLALSFVRRGDDVRDLRALLHSLGKQALIVSKIEKPEALTNIGDILAVSDAIMVARGDLGVELRPEQVPTAQEELVDLARACARPVIVATQMLESMITSPRPTRAEVTDVANAVRSGADAIMLSAETAAGRYPVEAVKMMDLIVRQTEGYMSAHGAFGDIDAYTPTGVTTDLRNSLPRSMAHAAAKLGRDLSASAVFVLARTEEDLALMSASHPSAPIVGMAPTASICGLGCLAWGVIPMPSTPAELDAPAEPIARIARQVEPIGAGTIVVVVTGLTSSAPTLTVRNA